MSYYYLEVSDGHGGVSPDSIQRLPDYAFVPNDPDNRDWNTYQDWLSEGNFPFPPGNFYEYLNDGTGNPRTDAVQLFPANTTVDNTMSPGAWDDYQAWLLQPNCTPLSIGFMEQ